MTGWMIALGLVAFLLLLPVRINAQYDEKGGSAWLTFGFLKLMLYPQEKKTGKQKKSNATSGKKTKGGAYSDFLPLLENVLELFSDFRHKLTVNKLQCRLILAGGDPCDLAVNYGRAWALVGNLIPVLERLFYIKKRDVSVGCDFADDCTRIIFHIQGRIATVRLLTIIAIHGTSILKKYYTIINQRKGGNVL